MRRHYDFSKAVPNPYAKSLTSEVEVQLDEATRRYFQSVADRFSIPVGTLIAICLRNHAEAKYVPTVEPGPPT